MSKQKKSDLTKLAELVAKQRGTKVSSARSFIRRQAKAKKPNLTGLTKYAQSKVRKQVRQIKEKTFIKIPDFFPDYDKLQKAVKQGVGITLQVYGSYEVYNSPKLDIRDRTVQFNLTKTQTKKFDEMLRSGDFIEAGKYLIGKVESFGNDSGSKLTIHEIEVF